LSAYSEIPYLILELAYKYITNKRQDYGIGSAQKCQGYRRHPRSVVTYSAEVAQRAEPKKNGISADKLRNVGAAAVDDSQLSRCCC